VIGRDHKVSVVSRGTRRLNQRTADDEMSAFDRRRAGRDDGENGHSGSLG
jgi:hypothetical protein